MCGRSLSFLSHPALVVLLYAVPGLLSILIVLWMVKEKMFKVQ